MATSRTTMPVQMPGAVSASEPAGDDAEALRAQLAALQAENARLAAQVPPVTSQGASVVVEPMTPHGKARLAESPTASMAVAEVMAAIDAGDMPEPMAHYLCRDGYYSRRS